MSAALIGPQVQAILQAAVDASSPPTPINVVLGIPAILNDDIVCYVFHDGSTDTPHAGPSVIKRTHRFAIHLMIRSDADAETGAESRLMALHDPIVSGFYTNRYLNGTASGSSQLRQLDAELASKVPFIKMNTGGEFRQRWFVLEAMEYLEFNFA